MVVHAVLFLGLIFWVITHIRSTESYNLYPLDMDNMTALEDEIEQIQLQLRLEDFENLSMVPWFSYRMRLPIRPLPSLSERPRITTKRLIVRPILLSDLDDLHKLRQRPDAQCHSPTRGRLDKTREEIRQSIEMYEQDDESHWYFGGFLQSTGELVAEGGLPDCNVMASSGSGWPEAEFIVKPEYWRQGYGTEFFHAVMSSWWALPRGWRRIQLIRSGMPGKEPGDEAMEGVVFRWEEHNGVAERFFTKVLENCKLYMSGSAESYDRREGREGNIVTWKGLMSANPSPQPIIEEDSEEGSYMVSDYGSDGELDGSNH